MNSELMAHNADDESRDKMVDILKRMQDDDNIDINDLIEYDDDHGEPADSDDEEADDLERRIENINLDDADEIWNALTEDEKNEFEALINRGEIGSIMPQWEPCGFIGEKRSYLKMLMLMLMMEKHLKIVRS